MLLVSYFVVLDKILPLGCECLVSLGSLCQCIPWLSPLRYTQNGILHMLDRNKRIKSKPERFQNCKDRFDLVITCEERVYDQVLEGEASWKKTSISHFPHFHVTRSCLSLCPFFLFISMSIPRSEFQRRGEPPASPCHQCGYSGQPWGSHSRRLSHLWTLSMCKCLLLKCHECFLYMHKSVLDEQISSVPRDLAIMYFSSKSYLLLSNTDSVKWSSTSADHAYGRHGEWHWGTITRVWGKEWQDFPSHRLLLLIAE